MSRGRGRPVVFTHPDGVKVKSREWQGTVRPRGSRGGRNSTSHLPSFCRHRHDPPQPSPRSHSDRIVPLNPPYPLPPPPEPRAAGETDLEYASIARAFDRWGLSTVSSLEPKAAAHTAARAPLDTAEMAGSLSAAAISPSDEAQNAVTLSSPAGSGAAAASQPSLDGLQPVPLWQHMPEPERRPPPVPSPELLALVDEAEHRGAEEARAREEADSGEDELVCLGASP